MKKIILLFAMLLSVVWLTGCMKTEQKNDNLPNGEETFENYEVDGMSQQELMDEFNQNFEDFEEKMTNEIDRMYDETDDISDISFDDSETNENVDEITDEDLSKLKEEMDNEFDEMLDELDRAAKTSR